MKAVAREIETPENFGGVSDAIWRFCSRRDKFVSETRREASVFANHSFAKSRVPSGNLYSNRSKQKQNSQAEGGK